MESRHVEDNDTDVDMTVIKEENIEEDDEQYLEYGDYDDIDNEETDINVISSSSDFTHDHNYFSHRVLFCSDGVKYDDLPRLEIIEQPCPLIRFRYMSELQGTPHGPISGEFSTKMNKTFPSVKLHNWAGEAIIRCWVIDPNGPAQPHVHDLVCRKWKNEILEEPHARIVNRTNNFIARFENLVVIRTAKKDGVDKYFKKHLLFQSSFKNVEDITFPTTTDEDIIEIKTLFQAMDKNSVRLFFEAITYVGDKIRRLCCISSNIVRNLKDPESAELKIVRCSRNRGSCIGGDEVFIFVRKIPKDISVEFFENDLDGNNKWKSYASFTHADIHFDCAIAFWTPPYKKVVKTPTDVFFRLFRSGDSAYSNAIPFTYLPSVESGEKVKRDIYVLKEPLKISVNSLFPGEENVLREKPKRIRKRKAIISL